MGQGTLTGPVEMQIDNGPVFSVRRPTRSYGLGGSDMTNLVHPLLNDHSVSNNRRGPYGTARDGSMNASYTGDVMDSVFYNISREFAGVSGDNNDLEEGDNSRSSASALNRIVSRINSIVGHEGGDGRSGVPIRSLRHGAPGAAFSIGGVRTLRDSLEEEERMEAPLNPVPQPVSQTRSLTESASDRHIRILQYGPDEGEDDTNISVVPPVAENNTNLDDHGEDDGVDAPMYEVPPGIDPTVFRELPEFMQAELIEANRYGGGLYNPFGGSAAAPSSRNHHSEMLGYDEDTLNELPVDIRQEILAEQERMFASNPQGSGGSGDGPNAAAAPAPKPDNESTKGSTLDREKIDIMALRRNLPLPIDLPPMGSLMPIKQGHISSLVRLLYVSNEFNAADWPATILLKIFQNLTSVNATRTELVRILIGLATGSLQRGDGATFPLRIFMG
jgi:hypothetical protein